MTPATLYIIVPCYNEQEVIRDTHSRLSALLAQMQSAGSISAKSRIMYVDDGSRDSTWKLIEEIVASGPDACGLKLAANAGHQNALMAGLAKSVTFCDIAITIDADLQDDIRAIPEMVKEYYAGNDIVMGVRKGRDTDTFFKRFTAQTYYKFLAACGVDIVYNHADFRLMSRRAIEALLQYRERNLFLRGIVTKLGYQRTNVYYDRLPRQAGETKYPLRKMLAFAMDGVTSFSIKPVRVIFTIGLLFMLIALAITIYSVVRYVEGETIQGWASLMISIWMCSGMLLMALGIVGEYIGKIYFEVKDRPLYNVDKFIS